MSSKRQIRVKQQISRMTVSNQVFQVYRHRAPIFSNGHRVIPNIVSRTKTIWKTPVLVLKFDSLKIVN
jgi:hypothetical protein